MSLHCLQADLEAFTTPEKATLERGMSKRELQDKVSKIAVSAADEAQTKGLRKDEAAKVWPNPNPNPNPNRMTKDEAAKVWHALHAMPSSVRGGNR